MLNLYQLKVTLKETDPPVWRRLIVPGNLNFARLHAAIQDAMGWEDSHLHSFKVGGVEIGTPDPDRFSFGPPVASEKQYTLDRVARADARFTYLYDFGDSWEHEIIVEMVTVGELEAPRCVAGERACPPEDCGGTPGYAELLDALADPTHERHEELTEWVSKDGPRTASTSRPPTVASRGTGRGRDGPGRRASREAGLAPGRDPLERRRWGGRSTTLHGTAGACAGRRGSRTHGSGWPRTEERSRSAAGA